MADLLDITPSTACEVVKIDGKRIVVRGLHIEAIASIISRFPELGTLLGNDGRFGPQTLARLGSAVGPIIAAGCGHLGDEKYEQHASQLLVEYQLPLVAAIIGLTLPNGHGPLVEAMEKLNLGGTNESKYIKVRLRKSPSPSQLSSDAGSRQIMQ